MVLQHERKDNFASAEDYQALINIVGFKKPNPKHGNSISPYNISKSKVFTHCGRTGHTIEVCYRKHGFPPHFGKGYMVNNTTTNDGDDNGIVVSSSTVNNGSSPITQNQFEKLVNLLHNLSLNQGIIHAVYNQVGSSLFTGQPPLNHRGKSHSLAYKCCSLYSWIIDFGTSGHICFSNS